jgi:sarcosine oxidase subunit beta
MANDEPHPINAPFTLERFRDGALIDEAAAAAVSH